MKGSKRTFASESSQAKDSYTKVPKRKDPKRTYPREGCQMLQPRLFASLEKIAS